jgi:hypothetical protein
MKTSPLLKLLLLLLLPVLFCSSAFSQETNPTNSSNPSNPSNPSKPPNPVDPTYIQNDKVRLGIDLGGGGSIFYFSERNPERNLLNHADKGRFIQQSYYGIEDGSMWDKRPWNWNPVQGGNWRGDSATILESTISSDHLYVKTMPKNWSTGGAYGEDIKDAVMEEWIELQGNVAKIHFRFTYSGAVDHDKRSAELPAFFADVALPNMVTYNGSAPWTGGELDRKVPFYLHEKKNQYGKTTESWAAYVDDKDWGVGLFFPGTTEMTYYRANGSAGPMGGGCSYFAPISHLTITKGFVYDYTIYLTIGTVNEIRERFTAIHASLTPPASVPAGESLAQPQATPIPIPTPRATPTPTPTQ